MDILSRTPVAADHRLHYGADVSQFGDLFLPKKKAGEKAPVIAFLHGGWWRSEYDLEYASHLCNALRDDGFAVWSIEYRRVGSTGGGWPATFLDAAEGFDYLATLARSYPLDTARVVAMGHSAGGHLAFWLAARHHVPESSVIHNPQPRVALHGAIALAGAVDLRLTIDLAGFSFGQGFSYVHDKREVYSLMGGTPADVPERYAAGDPGELLPLGVPQTLIQGAEDQQIPPELPGRWAEKAKRQGDEVRVRMVQSANHFDIVDPQGKAFGVARMAVREMFGR